MAGNLTEFSLDDKYTREEGCILLTGIQALVRLPLDQHRADRRRGLRTGTFIAGYRGSPLGGFDQALERQAKLLQEHHVFCSAALNEELAATAIFGSQLASIFPKAKYDGVLGIWYGKGPGVDRSGDAFKHANLAGTGRNGGVLAIGGDDPVSKSSTVPSDSAAAFFDALMPTVFPGNVQDLLDLGLHGFMLSRTSGLWVGLKLVTNVADGLGTAEVAPGRVGPVIPTVELDGRPFEPQLNPTLLAPHCLEMERTLHYARLELARRYAWENGLNRIILPTPNAWLGILTAGKTYYDVRQALQDLGLDDAALRRYGIRILKMGLIFPVEPRSIREFAHGLEEILIVEEKRPFLELFTKEALYGSTNQPMVAGKFDEQDQPLLPLNGELDADLIARAIARRMSRRLDVDSVTARIRYLDEVKRRPAPLTLARPAYFCSGCPHNRSTVVPDGHIAAAGIGCHTLAIGMDRNILGLTQMGGEGAQWIGLSPFTDVEHLFQNVGDGTLFHSGGLAINYAVASGANITYKILYNSAVAMTGGQRATGTLPVPALTRRLEAEGVKRIIVTTDATERYRRVTLAANAEVWHRDRLLEAQRVLADIPGVTALIHDQQCAAEKRRLRKRGKLAEPPQRVFINERVCEGCGDCGRKSNCLSVQPVETEFGRKTQIHQSSCNKDYSCLLGDCPAFITVVAGEKGKRGKGEKERDASARDPLRLFTASPFAPLRPLPDPELRVPSDRFSVYMMGIGGTGVVTANQILGTAALLDGKWVAGLDQTGLSQKGGPVVSHLRFCAPGEDVASAISTGGADLYLGFDLLVATQPKNLERADPAKTIAVISTSAVPTGRMVADTGVRFPEPSGLLESIERVARADIGFSLDAQAMAEDLFGDHMAANLITIGAAYQLGALPLSAAAIERAIALNGVGVEMNLAAFRSGRAAVAGPLPNPLPEGEGIVPPLPLGGCPSGRGRRPGEGVRSASPGAPPSGYPARRGRRSAAEPGEGTQRAPLSPSARSLIDPMGMTGELRRLLEVRVHELIDYQDVAYARRYVEFVGHVAQIEQAKVSGQTAVAEAVARYLFKLMAYKDEYEVARLHLESAAMAELAEKFGPGASIAWHLHPPLLRARGLKRKIGLGRWFIPGFKLLRTMKRLRGTPLDFFGYSKVRRVERALVDEYRSMVDAALAILTPENHAQVVALAVLPDDIRGYEDIKLASVERYRVAARRISAEIAAVVFPT